MESQRQSANRSIRFCPQCGASLHDDDSICMYCVVEWVFPSFGEHVLTFDRITYYNGYADRDELTEEQMEILRREGSMGCPPF